MKKLMFKLMNLAIMIAFIGVVSCEGPDGPEGPEGPKGDKGDPGVAGPTGPAGQDGEDGNANVTIISLLSEDITWEEGDYLGRVANTFTITNDAINEDIIDHGVVLGYCKLEVWYQLPFTWFDVEGSYIEQLLHTFSLNTITLYAYSTDGVLEPGAVTDYRFLLITDNSITGAKNASSEKDVISRLKDAGVDISNYNAVMDYFGLKY